VGSPKQHLDSRTAHICQLSRTGVDSKLEFICLSRTVDGEKDGSGEHFEGVWMGS